MAYSSPDLMTLFVESWVVIFWVILPFYKGKNGSTFSQLLSVRLIFYGNTSILYMGVGWGGGEMSFSLLDLYSTH